MNATLKSWLLWTLSFVSFPIGGVAAGLIAGPADGFGPTLIGGLITGAVIGAGQSLLSRRRLDWRRWIPASAAGMGLGLAAGAALVGYGTTLADLVLMGAVTGLALGVAQGVVLRSWIWAAAMPLLWALGWTVTTVAGVDVGSQFSVFGSTGALTVSALAGLLLHILRPVWTAIAVPVS